MKINEPVTDVEIPMQEDSVIVSKTDLKGIITYCNHTFVEISGYSEAELIGRNHNIVRHPDVPAAAFQDLWDTIRAGRPWIGIVKNRAKSGDHYWVKANVIPVQRDGQIVEYMSVRTKPTRQEIEQAEQLYRSINSGTFKGDRWLVRWRKRFTDLPLRWKFAAGTVLATLAVTIAAAWLAAATGSGGWQLPLTAATVSVLLGGLCWLGLKRVVLKPLQFTIDQLRRISEGHYYDEIGFQRGDELGDLLRGLKTMQVRLGFEVNEARERADQAQRIKTALDNVSSSVMMADNDGTIIYMNRTVEDLFREAEEDIRKDLPGFDAGRLLGASIDTFHRDPGHQRRLLAALQGTFDSQIEIGGRTLRIVANPVVNEAGERLGSAVEWTDRTDEVAVEREVEEIVSAARAGDLGRRIRLEDKEGFYRRLGSGVNELLDTLGMVFDDIASVMGRLARGDLSRPIERDYQGMFAMVKDDINESLQHLKEMVIRLRNAADEVNTASNEIAAGNNNLSARTEQQANSLEETASSMEELTSTVKNNADNAQQANQLAASARETAERGGNVVQRAVDAMEAINRSSNRIAEIIGVIDEIAFQTNLLALNASVEAARAGEQGRGFAVVATEVRNLAGRSATAAKEIKELIQDSGTKVRAGTELVNESGESLVEIVTGVKKVGDIVSEIAAASQEQSIGIDQVNRAVTSMDEATQQNAALAEQTSAASSALNEKAREMEALMGYFRTEPKPGEDGASVDFFKARLAHMAWRMRIRDFLDGRVTLSEEEAVSHRHCALGKWLYSTGLDSYGNHAEMQELEPEHERLHAVIREIVTLKNSGRSEQAEDRFAEIEALSERIVALLKGLERKVG
ncbi:MAG TPA: PAS domain S-box protein [Sedimenticola thiotaurini]|uniref:PAS domain S-box protein n=1 Tax=Sedimenticola thiotaurini TaxID=1543721 RepID=A0A831RM12_9GAMM|nr:PAS domain S-box protein [Sedimenticola thiotaurini]